MGLINRLKNFLRKGGASLGMVKSLTNITDDERIAMPASEYERIAVARRYYKDDLGKVKYKNSYSEEQSRELASVNVTKMAARRLASVIFNEQCTITADDKTANDLLEEVFADNDFYNQYEGKLEEALALGGGAIRPYVVNDKIKLAWINASQFYPLHTNTNEIKEAAVASTTTRVENHQTIYYTL